MARAAQQTQEKEPEIESQMFDQEGDSFDTYFSLEETGDQYFSLDEDTLGSREVKVLEGPEALRYLGLPTDRALCHLRRGDFGRINNRFRDLFRRWHVKAERTKRTINKDMAFWKNIKIRVWNKANVDKLTKTQIVGKKTAGCPSLNIEGVEYQGDIFDGRALSTFLSEIENSTRWKEVFVQLVSVTVTEEMRNA